MSYLMINDKLHCQGKGETLDTALVAAGEVVMPAHLRVFQVPASGNGVEITLKKSMRSVAPKSKVRDEAVWRLPVKDRVK